MSHLLIGIRHIRRHMTFEVSVLCEYCDPYHARQKFISENEDGLTEKFIGCMECRRGFPLFLDDDKCYRVETYDDRLDVFLYTGWTWKFILSWEYGLLGSYYENKSLPLPGW